MITGSQARMARAALKWGVRDIAKAASVSPATISRVEAGGGEAHGSTLAMIKMAYEAAGIEFIERNGGGPGVRLRKE